MISWFDLNYLKIDHIMGSNLRAARCAFDPRCNQFTLLVETSVVWQRGNRGPSPPNNRQLFNFSKSRKKNYNRFYGVV
eukprot:g72477.t1